LFEKSQASALQHRLFQLTIISVGCNRIATERCMEFRMNVRNGFCDVIDVPPAGQAVWGTDECYGSQLRAQPLNI
jgi:hypothetical protein